MRRLMTIAAASMLINGCRGDVEGAWKGHIGGEPADLVLEQVGEVIDGRLCLAETCSGVAGSLVDQRLELELGCSVCDFRPTTLDLEVAGNTMRGIAIVDHCDPAQESCLLPVALQR